MPPTIRMSENASDRRNTRPFSYEMSPGGRDKSTVLSDSEEDARFELGRDEGVGPIRMVAEEIEQRAQVARPEALRFGSMLPGKRLRPEDHPPHGQLPGRVEPCAQLAAMRPKQGILIPALRKALEDFIGFRGIAVDEEEWRREAPEEDGHRGRAYKPSGFSNPRRLEVG